MTKRNVRFWTRANGTYTKLTLEPGEILRFGYARPTEEGWESHGEEIELSEDGEQLRLEWQSDGSDCDGRLSRGGIRVASADPKDFVKCYQFKGMRPDWKEKDSYKRDYQAEAAGY